jgi:hypothetical protein
MIRQLRLLLAGFVFVAVFTGAGAGASAQFELFEDPCKDNPAASVCQDKNTTQTANNNSIYGPDGAVGKIVRIMSIVIGAAAVIVIIIAGIKYMTSSGDANSVNNAKNTIIYALIGLLVAILAQVIVYFVIGRIFS